MAVVRELILLLMSCMRLLVLSSLFLCGFKLLASGLDWLRRVAFLATRFFSCAASFLSCCRMASELGAAA